MNAKERFYSGMARETISKITASKENWTAFLTTMARNYEFTYPEQVMIYAQRPNATFCKPYDEWNDEKYRRYVKRGSTGIALFVTSGNKPYLRYVFDVADTGIRRSSPELKAWEVTAENRAFLMSAMERSFGVKAEGLLEAQLEDIAMTLATEYWADHQKPFLDIVANSFLEEYDELNIEVAFKTAVANSVAYTMYSRLVENPDHYFEHEDFQKVFDFNSRQTVNALGTAVNEISTRMFQEIEKAIDEFEQSKDTERSEYDERDDLQTGWGLQNSGYGAGEPERQNPGQVWQDAQSISGAEQSNASERPDFDGETVPASVGDRGRSERQNGTADEAVSGTESGTGQGNRPDGLGKTHEQPESTGRGSRDDGAYQQLSLNLFPSENEQISFIDRAESFTPSAFSFAQEAIDHFLLLGSNTDEARKIVVLEYMKQKSTEEIVQTLKQVYHGGFGLKEESGNISAWYAEDGIHLAKGASAIDSPRAQVIPWEDAVSRIGELLEQGKFATNVELEEAAEYERMGVAQSIWYLYHDLSDEARNMGFFPSLTDIQGNGFPKETEWLAEQLDQPEFLEALKAEYRSFITAHDTDRSLLRFHYHKLDVLGKRLDELNIPLKEYQSEMMYVPLVRQFITDDEINADMTRGSDFAGGKARIYEYWQEPHSTQERADFLKHEFGIGGHSHACSGATHSGQEHDAKGIRYQKSGCDNVQMSWTQVAQRIDSLMKKGRYLTVEEDVERQEIEDAKADPLEDVYDRFAVIDTEDGEYAIWDNQTDDYYVDHEGVTEYFTDEWLANDYLEEVRQTVVAMENVQSEVPVEEVAEVSDAPIPEVSEWNYQVGDTVYLDDTAFRIEQIKEREVQLRDHSLSYPIFRVENRELFERMLAQDERNQSVKAGAVVEGKPVPAVNFHITDDHIGEGGPKQKFARNIEAIETLFKLENENRNATPEEQEILANFVGWGGLSDAFDPDKGNWAQEYMTLKNLLSEDEYAAARTSTLNAHYTSPTVIRSIYDTVGQMGFETGNILEPSMGIGNFFGMLPPEMQSSRLYGVELDSITGRIAQKLYPNAEIKVAGFETTDRRDFYDLAVGNVPFGNYKVSDKPYDKLGFSIHNYFFAKALDQVRPGGVVAFVTSRYTMDSKNSDARRHLAQRAELLGAIRLPNDAFKKNAGTEVVSDIIFLQKRDHPIDIVPDWVHLNRTDDGHTMNSYFVEHPEMILGETVEESTAYGMDITVRPIEGAELSDLLKEAVSHIEGIYQAVELSEAEKGKEAETIPATPDVKNFSYTVVDGEVYFRENSIMRHLDLNEKAKERVAGMVELRGIVNELIEYQLEDFPDEMISQKQAELNTAYDAFTAKHGLINHRANAQAFAEDSSYYLLCSLENVDEDGKLKSKADMFTKRTIKPERRVTSVDTPSEALAISIGERGKVDLPFMAQLLGTPEEYDTIKAELQGVIFKDPMGPDAPEAGWQTADEYLSGDVRSKLRIAEMAAKQDSSFNINVEALQKAQPKDLDASEIDVRLGATWIDPDYIQQFMQETFETPYYLRRAIEVKFSEMTAEWRINGKSAPNYNDVAAYMTYGTDRANAYRILEETLNLKDIRIYDTVEDPDGKQKRVLNKKETTLAQQKQQAIKDAFRDWIWKDPRRREALVTKYNELFNSTRPREYDGSHIRFGGMNPDITLREHQRNAIAHVLYGGNTLLAHEVGAGKTFEMAASAMESKRLGLSQKSMFVVPNHLTLQWANEFLRLYPSAKLLVATKKDFETANRKKFCARIATGDYDAVIIGHSQFERIPLSAERQERQLREQIDEIEGSIAELKYQRGENFTIKQMEKTRKSLEARLDKLLATDKKDDVITFEQLGVDRLFVDESHAFKNLFLYTKMRNVAGLSTSEAQKSSDMFMKCRYMDEITGGRGVVFATGTPVSNSMTELYTVMRYLQYGTLQQKNLTHFDSWASTFGETTTAIELAPEGYTLIGR